jgi:hypothetical protein
MRPLPILHLHDWGKMEVCLINFKKGEDDEGCLKFCNILKVMVNKPSNIKKKRTITSHLHLLNTKRGTTTYNIKNPAPVLGQA